MPPFAVPSSLVSTTPVRSTASANACAWRRPFWPVVASITISDSCGAPSSRFAATRRTFASSAIRFAWVCRRPAVSAITTSAPRDSAAAIASKTTAPGSPPGRAADDLGAGPLRPRLELLDRGGAIGVGRGDDHRQAELVPQVPGELADRRRLAGPVDADDHDHRGAAPQIDPSGVAARDLGEQLDQSLAHGVGPRDAAGLDLGLEPPDDVGGGPAPRRRRGSAPPRAAPRSRRRAARRGSSRARPASACAALRQALSQAAKHASLLLLRWFGIAAWRRVGPHRLPGRMPRARSWPWRARLSGPRCQARRLGGLGRLAAGLVRV